MSHIFISYSTQNSEYAYRLADKLRDEGFDVWIDNAELRSSENWWESIVRALRAADAFIVIMTPESRASRWVQREVTLADNWRKQSFPLLLDGENFEIYVLTQFIDVRDRHLPAQSFYDDLARYAKRTTQGKVVTTEPQNVTLDYDSQIEAALNDPPPDDLNDSAIHSRVESRVDIKSAASPSKMTIIGIGVFVGVLLIVGVFAANMLWNGTPSEESATLTAQSIANVPSETPETITPTNTLVAPSITPSLTIPTDTSVAPSETPNTSEGGGSADLVFSRGSLVYSDIYLLDLETDEETQLTNNRGVNSHPSWSHDGTQIAFNSNRDGNAEIYVMNVDGTNQVRLTDNEANDYSPSWSPDGSQITFYSNRDGNDNIYVMNVDGTNQVRLTDNEANDYSPSWSPDGSQIAFVSYRDGNQEIYVMNADGSNQVRLTENEANDYSPSWSPDGSQIAFRSYRDGNQEIYVMNADGSNQVRLTDNEANDDHPSWSPDGSQIAFMSYRDDNFEIYIMNTDGSDQQRITNTLEIEWYPSWRP